jgi:hypothetical protein
MSSQRLSSHPRRSNRARIPPATLTVGGRELNVTDIRPPANVGGAEFTTRTIAA